MIAQKILSIIIPCFNEYVSDKCLKGFEELTSVDAEFIIIDDASDEVYKDQYKKLEAYSNIKILYNDVNKGVSCTRNIGLRVAKGKYILFADADDLIDYRKLKDIASGLEEADIYCLDYRILNDGTEKIMTRPNLDANEDSAGLLKDLLSNKNNTVWCNIYRRDIMINNNITYDEDLYLGEDLLFNLYFWQKISSVMYLREIYYTHVIASSSSITSSTSFDKVIQFCKIYDRVIPFYEMEPTSNFPHEYFLNCVFKYTFSIKDKTNDKIREFESSDLYKRLISIPTVNRSGSFRRIVLSLGLYKSKNFCSLIRLIK